MPPPIGPPVLKRYASFPRGRRAEAASDPYGADRGSRILSYIMARPKTDSTVLTVRVPVALEKRLAREARRRRQTRSEIARNILEAGLGPTGSELEVEARRQSLLASRRRSDREMLRFMTAIADTTGWRS